MPRYIIVFILTDQIHLLRFTCMSRLKQAVEQLTTCEDAEVKVISAEYFWKDAVVFKEHMHI